MKKKLTKMDKVWIKLWTEKEPRMEEQTIRALMKQEGITRERAKEFTGYQGLS